MNNNQEIRKVLAAMPSDHDASGVYRPTVEEIFTPAQHANALDPNTTVVVGSRGTGKSFWAGVLEQPETRALAASVYSHIGLDNSIVRSGYTGFSGGGVGSRAISQYVPDGEERVIGIDFWTAVILKAAISAFAKGPDVPSIKELMKLCADPEAADSQLAEIDQRLVKKGKRLIITFDALDTIAHDWKRATALTDTLFEVTWSLRAFRAIKAKIFIRPEQLNDDGLRFVEMPKIRSSRVQLEWSMLDLYGLLYWRLSETKQGSAKSAFSAVAADVGFKFPLDRIQRRLTWRLLDNRQAQELLMSRLAGQYMGRGIKKGRTYEWPYRHLADARGEVTPRSFVKLFVEAARFGGTNEYAISAEGIRRGLKEASKVRVEQLVIEYKWVKRALAPLAGLLVPCNAQQVYSRWEASNTLQVIRQAASSAENGFLPPFPYSKDKLADDPRRLAQAMERIGVISWRTDGRIDMPDLFRVAARMLKKGSVSP